MLRFASPFLFPWPPGFDSGITRDIGDHAKNSSLPSCMLGLKHPLQLCTNHRLVAQPCAFAIQSLVSLSVFLSPFSFSCFSLGSPRMTSSFVSHARPLLSQASTCASGISLLQLPAAH